MFVLDPACLCNGWVVWNNRSAAIPTTPACDHLAMKAFVLMSTLSSKASSETQSEPCKLDLQKFRKIPAQMSNVCMGSLRMCQSAYSKLAQLKACGQEKDKHVLCSVGLFLHSPGYCPSVSVDQDVQFWLAFIRDPQASCSACAHLHPVSFVHSRIFIDLHLLQTLVTALSSNPGRCWDFVHSYLTWRSSTPTQIPSIIELTGYTPPTPSVHPQLLFSSSTALYLPGLVWFVENYLQAKLSECMMEYLSNLFQWPPSVWGEFFVQQTEEEDVSKRKTFFMYSPTSHAQKFTFSCIDWNRSHVNQRHELLRPWRIWSKFVFYLKTGFLGAFPVSASLNPLKFLVTYTVTTDQPLVPFANLKRLLDQQCAITTAVPKWPLSQHSNLLEFSGTFNKFMLTYCLFMSIWKGEDAAADLKQTTSGQFLSFHSISCVISIYRRTIPLAFSDSFSDEDLVVCLTSHKWSFRKGMTLALDVLYLLSLSRFFCFNPNHPQDISGFFTRMQLEEKMLAQRRQKIKDANKNNTGHAQAGPTSELFSVNSYMLSEFKRNHELMNHSIPDRPCSEKVPSSSKRKTSQERLDRFSAPSFYKNNPYVYWPNEHRILAKIDVFKTVCASNLRFARLLYNIYGDVPGPPTSKCSTLFKLLFSKL